MRHAWVYRAWVFRAWIFRAWALLPDAVLLGFALLQLSPFLAAFHQSADDNFWQYAVLSTGGSPAALGEAIRRVAETQGRIGLYATMPLVMLGAMLPEYAWGRVLVVALLGALVLGFGHLLARRFGAPLTRASLLLSLCLMPVAAHHMPPNSYPLLITLPLAAMVGLHLRFGRWLGGGEAAPRGAVLAGMAGMAALALMMEYNLVAGAGLAALAVLTAGVGRRWRAVRLHAPPLLVAAVVYAAYRAAFPSGYAGNVMAPPGLGDVVRLQALHALNGTSLPFLGIHPAGFPVLGRTDLVLAAGILASGSWLAWRLLPALAAAMTAGLATRVVLAAAAWAWLNTLPHALTGKYQEWCRLGDCAYVDSRVAALGFGAAAAVGLAALVRAAGGGARDGRVRHGGMGLGGAEAFGAGCGRAGCADRKGAGAGGKGAGGKGAGLRRAVSLACALGVGVLGAGSFLENRASARGMSERERAFAVLRGAACRPEVGLGRMPVVMEMLARSIWWHPPPAAVPPAGDYLAAYRGGLEGLGLACRPLPFAPPTRSVEFLGWAGEGAAVAGGAAGAGMPDVWAPDARAWAARAAAARASAAPTPGRWTLGPGGLLLLAGEAGTRGMVLTLAAYAPRAGGVQRVVARLGDGTACEMRLDAVPVDLLVPWDAGAPGWARGREAVLVLETPDAVSPMEAGESEDRRRLGVLLSGARPWPADGEGDAVAGGRAAGRLDMRGCARATG